VGLSDGGAGMMDEQRLQAYVALIEKLFACPGGEEGAVLQRHSDLVDGGLVQVMGAVVAQLRQQGEGQRADWLENLAGQVAQAIWMAEAQEPEQPSEPGTIDEQRMQAYTQVVQELLSCPNGKEALVLQHHQALVDEGLVWVIGQVAAILRQREEENIAKWLENIAIQLTQSFGDAEITPNTKTEHLQAISQELIQITDERDMARKIALCQQALELVSRRDNEQLWGALQMLLGSSLRQKSLGDLGQNLEDSISAYEKALEVFTRDAMPEEWAESMNALATSYVERFLGDRAQNIEDAITYCKQALQVRAHDSMPVEWSESMNNLAVAYSVRVLSDRAENLENSIIYYKQSLQVRTFENMPIEWAQSMVNLANAYIFRIRDDRADNIEQAIAFHKEASQVMTCEAMPVEWARSVMDLANVYLLRIRGDRAQNLENAIVAYQQSLQVMTCETMPVEWARSLRNLSNAYCRRLKGDRARNIEDAILVCQQSLQVMTREAMPMEWAQSMQSLANAYSFRICGDRAQNIEDAITTYEQPLEVMTREAMPMEWAQLMGNLALAYYKRTLGDRADNIENAICAYRQSLRVITREAMPVEWADFMNNLSVAYSDRIRGDLAQNVEDAIAFCEQALQVRTNKAMPIEWAISMTNLAKAYLQRIQGDKAGNIENAISALARSFQVRTRDNFPEDWAMTQNSLAIAYSNRIHGDRTGNIEVAISAYSQSLEIFTPEAHPNDCRKTARLLANLYADHDRWSDAQTTYRTALTAAEILYQAAISKGSQEAELKETNDLYRRAAYAYAKVGNLETAVATIEQGRARSLSETLQRDRADLEAIRQIKPELVDRYQTAANAIRLLESTERRTGLDSNQPQYSAEDFRNQATQARQALQDGLTEIRQIPGYESFLTLPTFADIAATLQPSQPLIYLLPTPNGSLALMVHLPSPKLGRGAGGEGLGSPGSAWEPAAEAPPPGNEAPSQRLGARSEAIWLDSFTEADLRELLYGPADDPKLGGWFGAYQNSTADRATWFATLDRITQHLWAPIFEPIQNSKLGIQNFTTITLIPTGLFSLLPLHAAWTEDAAGDRRTACDDLTITYAPNALSLKAAHTVAAQTPATALLAINNPTEDLSGAGYEVQNAIAQFPDRNTWKMLQREKATRAAVLEALPNHSVAHFACHGSANFQQPLDSGLLMANDEILSLRDLLDLKLQGLRLAVLSACETGIPGTDLPDEVISLPTGLLQAGAAGVVSSLWSVDDRSTMILLSRFYQLWRTDGLEPPAALRKAQLWLRDRTGPELAAYLKKCHPAQAQDPNSELAKSIEEFEDSPKQYPLAHPFHWAAFTYTGV
jgi:CHAT domain-containing protein/tetratricopeptide (TPR) repeat protein